VTKRILSNLSNLLSKWLEDLFVFVGTAFIVATTYSINELAGNYLLGVVLVAVGLLLAKK